jgi:hypothetical protein
MPSASPSDLLAPVYDAALRADMAAGLALLDALPAHALSPAQRDVASALRARFAASPPAVAEDLPSATAAILRAYRAYWRRAMLAPAARSDAEGALLHDLAPVLAEQGALPADLDAAADAAKAAIEAEGLHALTGVTLPLYELMVWRSSTRTTYRVALPGQHVDVGVVFLDGFVSLGWAAYATCERSHTSGWATATELYAVKSAYDVDSEQFRVSYLAHEGQHFADYAAFPKLARPELEYRAKLAEIALADATTHDLVTRFAAQTGEDRGIPHAYANAFVTRGLARAVLGRDAAPDAADDWRRVPRERLNGAARDLLDACTRGLRARGAATVERWLGE